MGRILNSGMYFLWSLVTILSHVIKYGTLFVVVFYIRFCSLASRLYFLNFSYLTKDSRFWLVISISTIMIFFFFLSKTRILGLLWETLTSVAILVSTRISTWSFSWSLVPNDSWSSLSYTCCTKEDVYI